MACVCPTTYASSIWTMRLGVGNDASRASKSANRADGEAGSRPTPPNAPPPPPPPVLGTPKGTPPAPSTVAVAPVAVAPVAASLVPPGTAVGSMPCDVNPMLGSTARAAARPGMAA